MIILRIFLFLFLSCILRECEAKRVRKQASGKEEVLKVCLTPACKTAATTIRESIDPKVAPCDDFYGFACGNFLKTTAIPKDDVRVDRYNSLETKTQGQLKKSIEEPIQPNEPRWITLTKNFYKACMNLTAIKKNSVNTLLGKFKEAGCWPLLEGVSGKEENFDWKKATYDMQKLGFNTHQFLDFRVVPDFRNNTKRVLAIDQPNFSIDRDTFVEGFKNKGVTAYYNYMVEVAVILGANRARAEKELKEAVEFQSNLANICVSGKARVNDNALSKPMTVRKLTKKYPSIPWKEYFNTLLKSIVVIGDDEVIVVNVPTFVENFEVLMKKTPKRVLANYLFMRIVEENASFLTDEIQNLSTKYIAVVLGSTERAVRWKDCLMVTSQTLVESASALYVRNYFTAESKKSAEEVAVNIEEQLKKLLKQVDWMDEKTRTSALEKLESMKNFVGYSNEILQDKILNEYYKTLEVTPSDYLQTMLNIHVFWRQQSFNQLRKPVDKSDWTSHIDTLSENSAAGYSQPGNSVDVPAVMLQDIFFNKDRPQYLNYAGIGSFDLGPEIIHALDNQGRKFDKNGNFKDWWTPETNKKFLQKAACITQQYGCYTVKEADVKLNGTSTQDTNIADNGGVKAAYLAYQDLVKQKGPEPKLPGLNYSQSQLFWIHAAVQQCAKYTPKFLKNILLPNDISIPEVRINGAFSNRPEFATDFKCPVGSKMNPVKKCSVW